MRYHDLRIDSWYVGLALKPQGVLGMSLSLLFISAIVPTMTSIASSFGNQSLASARHRGFRATGNEAETAIRTSSAKPRTDVLLSADP